MRFLPTSAIGRQTRIRKGVPRHPQKYWGMWPTQHMTGSCVPTRTTGGAKTSPPTDGTTTENQEPNQDEVLADKSTACGAEKSIDEFEKNLYKERWHRDTSTFTSASFSSSIHELMTDYIPRATIKFGDGESDIEHWTQERLWSHMHVTAAGKLLFPNPETVQQQLLPDPELDTPFATAQKPLHPPLAHLHANHRPTTTQKNKPHRTLGTGALFSPLPFPLLSQFLLSSPRALPSDLLFTKLFLIPVCFCLGKHLTQNPISRRNLHGGQNDYHTFVFSGNFSRPELPRIGTSNNSSDR